MKSLYSISLERWVLAGIITAFFVLFFIVGCSAFITSNYLLGLISLVALVVFTPLVAQKLTVAFDGLYQKKWLLCIIWLIFALAALARTAGVGLYMADAEQPQASAMYNNDFYINHSCLSGYWKAGEVGLEGEQSIYQTDTYAGFEGRFKIDEFLYPPQFLLLPQSATALGLNFLQMRAVWFAIDAALVASVMLALCCWIGGSAGRGGALLLPAIWLATPTLLTLQTGNFQLAAIALSILAMLFFEQQKNITGAAFLGFAAFKIFPGILCLYLLLTKRWIALVWTIVFCLFYSLIAFSIMGLEPFEEFLFYQLPKIASGELWYWLEIEGLEGVVAINDSIPGLVLKLKLLGVTGLDWHTMAIVAWVWTALVVAIAYLVAKINPLLSRVQKAQVWIVLLGLATLRSYFVPDDYGLFPALWLLCLVAGASQYSMTRSSLWIVLAIAFGSVMPIDFVNTQYVSLILLLSTISQILAVSFCFWILFEIKKTHGKFISSKTSPTIFSQPSINVLAE